MKNKTILITGGNAGIGKATAQQLAAKDATIILACRNLKKGKIAAKDIVQKTGNTKVEVLELDLSDFESIREFAAQFKTKYAKLDVLINNAGMITQDFKTTKQGYEYQFGVNHLGHFLLTQLLLDDLKKADKARVINVSSKAHFGGKLDFESFKKDKNYSSMTAYRQSKLANVYFTREFARRYPDINAYCLHPGVVRTGFANKEMNWFVSLMWTLMKPFFITAEKGAKTSVWLASSPEVEGKSGAYFDNKKEYKPSKVARDEAMAERLWGYSLGAVRKYV